MAEIAWPEIYFIRHGETPWNAEKRYQGRKDIPLNARGQAQADRNGVVLHKVLAERGIDPASLQWHASPLTRTRETMERVRAAFPAPLPEVQFDVRLVEISFGALEGLLHSELPSDLVTATGERDASYWEFRPEAGENYRDVEARLLEFAGVLTGPSVVVAHGGIARTLRVLIEGAAIGDVINWAPPQDVIMHFRPGMMELIGG
ncbi:histidine phosphatase family protein [Arsenicitalea aurantiaca]|uniref:Histidine phosphatase family protein n=1 Tax=Arsenicitalea aurantiaca TaxID=1783274 RepID=A0A433XAJ7_9HYPH|nr:histidine phosphatase family protein [Arsenicitalea aurantiaca]RUT31121.1 histidine phosphatase family protein [Arsenicitalea aurantiaca]